MARAIKRAETAKAHRWLARFCMWRGRLLAAARAWRRRHWLEQAQHVARGLTDAQLSRDVFVATADVDARRGRVRAGGRLPARGLAAVDEAGRQHAPECLMPLALTYARMGDQRPPCRPSRRPRPGEGRERPVVIVPAVALLAQIYYHAPQSGSLRRAAARAVEIAREAGLPYEAALNAHHMGESYLRLGTTAAPLRPCATATRSRPNAGYTRLQMSNLRALGLHRRDTLRLGRGTQPRGPGRRLRREPRVRLGHHPGQVLPGRHRAGAAATWRPRARCCAKC